MKPQQLRELSDVDLARRLGELKAELFNLRFQRMAGQLDNPMRFRQIRRQVARVLTEQRRRELGAKVE